MLRGGRVIASLSVLLACAGLGAGCSRDEGPTAAPPRAETELFCEPSSDDAGGFTSSCIAADAGESRDREPIVPTEKKRWEESVGGVDAARAHLKRRLAGWPSRLLADPHSLPEEGRPFLRRVAVDTWRGLSSLVDREHSLPVDNVRFPSGSVDDTEYRIGDYASSSSLGIYLVAIVAARELELISPEDAAQRARALVDTTRQLEIFKGFLFNFYDTTTLERTSSFVSFIDSAWSTAGLIVARNAFPELRDLFTEIIDSRDYSFFYDEALRRMSLGYDVASGLPSTYHYGAFFTEARLGSLIAIGKGDVPVAHWAAMDRHLPAACGATEGWPNCSSTGETQSRPVAHWNGVAYVPSWGGSMFEALMPTLLLDEQRWSPQALGANDVAHATIQRRYATETLRYPVWGMSPAMNPATGRYAEFGVPLLGNRGYPVGVVSPHATALALSVTPDLAIDNLRRLAETYPIYGEFGFYDSGDPVSGEVSYSYLTLDQSMILIAIANLLTDHSIQNFFTDDPIVAASLPLVRGERLFD